MRVSNVRLVHCPHPVVRQLSLRWSSVSASYPPNVSDLPERPSRACRAALVGQAVHQHICEQRR
jgi:hypothetical protein